MKGQPHAGRHGWLKHGNPPGDLSTVARCGAKTRRGTPCKGPAMTNGRCRMHGGTSTGPRTPEGLERSRKARLKHGAYSREFREIRAAARIRRKTLRELLDSLDG
jgi:hypothetical protein